MFPQDSLKHPTVRDFLSSQLGDEGLTAEHIINFLHNGSPESREKGMADFDWRNIFSAVDRALRLLSQYLEVRAAFPLLGILVRYLRQYLRSVATDKVKIIRHLYLFQTFNLNVLKNFEFEPQTLCSEC